MGSGTVVEEAILQKLAEAGLEGSYSPAITIDTQVRRSSRPLPMLQQGLGRVGC